MLGNRKIDEVSPMFISEHANTRDKKQILQILFYNNPNKFSCDSYSLFIKMCIPLLEYVFEEIYVWVLVHFPKHQLVIEPSAKTVWKKVQKKSKSSFSVKAK